VLGDRRPEKAVKRRAKDYPVARRLMTIPGVGPVNALSFIALVDDAGRFSWASATHAPNGRWPRKSTRSTSRVAQQGAIGSSPMDGGINETLIRDLAT
jgi:transposase